MQNKNPLLRKRVDISNNILISALISHGTMKSMIFIEFENDIRNISRTQLH